MSLASGRSATKGITYTTREKIIDIGPIEASADTQKTFPLPPIAGGLAIAREELGWSLLGVKSHNGYRRLLTS